VGSGPRWVRAATVQHGHQRSPSVADGLEEPQVASRPAHVAGTTRTGDSDCGPEGRGFESHRPTRSTALLNPPFSGAGSTSSPASSRPHSCPSPDSAV
jgi:hypothetical protein